MIGIHWESRRSATRRSIEGTRAFHRRAPILSKLPFPACAIYKRAHIEREFSPTPAPCHSCEKGATLLGLRGFGSPSRRVKCGSFGSSPTSRRAGLGSRSGSRSPGCVARALRLHFGPASARQPCGGMAEWFKAAVLKTAEPQGSVGSNPTPSASCLWWRGGRVAEGSRLLSG
jgi:hypothetical protein